MKIKNMTGSAKMTQEEKIILFMKEDSYIPLLLEELIGVLDVPKDEIGNFLTVIDKLENEGKIIKTKKKRYNLPENVGIVIGKFQGNERGYGFVISDDETIADVFIPAEYTANAMNNDRVLARMTRKNIGGPNSEGEVIRILQRHNREIIGLFEHNNNFGFLIPDDRKIDTDIFISKDNFNGAKAGQKVIVEVIKWPTGRRNPEGKVLEVLGYANEPGVDILSIIKQFKISEEFPEKVIKQIQGIEDKVFTQEIEKRTDLRKLNTITIDGEDAKDLDDAISIEKTSQGNYKLGVHIADVSHYVTEKSPLDKEAYQRGTSIYIIDRVIPMLPKKLSNGICSLNPDEDRLTLSVIMEIDYTGKVINYEILESVIKNKARMTYENVSKIIEGDRQLIEKYKDIVNDIKLAKELALILKKKRKERGSIDFNFPEMKIILDKVGKPIEIEKYEVTISNKIIEEFMLVCNETIAEHMFWLNVPSIYRVHEEPNVEKIKDFSILIHNLGYKLKGISKIHPGVLQELLDEIKGKKEEKIISTVMLRSLMKAKYLNNNLGHFGLAAKYYCHFTAPIRRYPDLIVHRILKENIKKGINSNREKFLKEFTNKAAKQASEKEVYAEEIEREVEELKKVEFMQDKVGDIFDGIISGVTSFGLFVELDNTIEGLVRLSDIIDDYYIYNQNQYTLTGERTKKIYKIGDQVRVQLVRADISQRKLSFIII